MSTIIAATVVAFAAGCAVGVLGQKHVDRRRVAEVEHRAALADHFRAAADRLADELDEVRTEASTAILTLRGTVAEQARIVRAALGRPQKRRVPAGGPS